MNGKKKVTAIFACLAMAVSTLTTGFLTVRSVDAQTENTDWAGYAGGVTMSVENEDGFASMQGLTQKTEGASRAGYVSKIRLDGATIAMRDTGTMALGDYMGFYFATSYDASFPTASGADGFVVNSRKGFTGGSLGGSQTRLGINSGWEISKDETTLAYPTLEALKTNEKKGFGVSNSLVTNNKDNWGVSVRFTFVDDATAVSGEIGYWEIQITQLYDHIIWGSSYNYGFDDVDTVTTYVKHSALKDKLDVDGNTYVIAFGTDYQATDKTPAPQFFVDDENERVYNTQKAQLLMDAESAVSAFEAGAYRATSYVDFVTCRNLKNEADNIVGYLRGADGAGFLTRIQTAWTALLEKNVDSLADQEWVDVGTETQTLAAYDAETRYTSLHNLDSWGKRAYLTNKIHLDGATVYMRNEGTGADGDFFGVAFSANCEDYYESAPMAMVLWKGLYGNGSQTRLHIGANHNYNLASYVWPTQNYTLGSYSKQFGVDNTLVFTDADNYGVSVHFEYVKDADNAEGGYWKLTIQSAFSGFTMWTGGNTPNYNASDKTCTVYVRPSVMKACLDENGDTYLIAGAIAPKTSLQYKVDDAHYTEYATTTLAGMQARVAQYQTLVEQATGESFESLLQTRETLMQDLQTLRGNDASLQTALVLKYDETLSTNENIQTYLRTGIQAEYDKAQTAATQLQTESQITADNLALAQSALQTAKSVYAQYEKMLSDGNRAHFTQSTATLEYAIAHAEAMMWLITYETAIASIPSQDMQTLASVIASTQQMRTEYPQTAAYAIVEQTLTATDKQAYEARLANAHANLDEAVTVYGTAMKTHYLTILQQALEQNLGNKTLLDQAYNAYESLHQYVTITAEDEMYEAYSTAVQSFTEASELYITRRLSVLESELSKTHTRLNTFADVKTVYESLDTRYLQFSAESLQEKYQTLKAQVEAHNLYYFTTNGNIYLENTDAGMYLEYMPIWGNRVHYNKQLDLTKGVSITMTMDEFESLVTKNSNNVFLNFLSAPNSFKGESDGITVVLWLSDSSETSYMRVYNYTDAEIGYMAFRTPVEGAQITITLKYGEYTDYDGSTYYAYMIDINDGEAFLAFTEEQLTANGHTVSTDVYFSIGGVSNFQSAVNGITINSICEGTEVKNFALREIAPDEDPIPDYNPSDSSSDSSDSSDSSSLTSSPNSSSEGGKKGGCGASVELGVAFVLGISAFVVASKRKEQEGGNE